MTQIRLTESVAQEKLRVDREAGIIFDAKLCGSISRNNRRYAPTAMRNLAALYENRPIRIGHDVPDSEKYEKTVGSPTDISIKEEPGTEVMSVRGNLSMNKGHPLYEQLMDDAERRPHLLMISHEVPANGYRATKKGGELIVETVSAVDCLAIVTNGGVNSSLFEAKEKPMPIDSVKGLREEYPTLCEQITQEGAKTVKDANAEKLAETIAARDANVTKIKELEEKVATLEAQIASRERRDALLKESEELKVKEISPELLEALMALEPEKATTILKQQPKIVEGEKQESEEEESAEQKSSIGGKKVAAKRLLTATERMEQSLN